MLRVKGLMLSAMLIACGTGAVAAEPLSVDAAMDQIVSRLYQTHSLEELKALDEAAILDFITPAEREALATRHVQFRVNVPATVSVLRHAGQASMPFWMPEAGFEKTDRTVTNSQGWVYEVWQRDYPAGPVGLGINGFGNHRQHYFVSVAAQDAEASLTLTDVLPARFEVRRLHPGASVYHDWTSLVLEEVPEALRGQHYLTTIRGRARAAHLIGAFRTTPHPSQPAPDQVTLSWTGAPQTTQTVSWRTNTAVTDGVVRVRVQGEGDTLREVAAEHAVVEDRFLANDRYCHRHVVELRGLQPGTAYEYQVGSASGGDWSAWSKFRTAPAAPEPFTFIAFGDTQSMEPWAPVAEAALRDYPDAAFQLIAGDLVGTGQYRDHWDRFFATGAPLTQRWPLMPALGNHDVIDGLGADMWRAAHALPLNGPSHLEPERVYAFEYSNALFVVLDSGLPIMEQAAWLEAQLANTDADWKVVMYHFPPYNYEHPYPEIKSLWGYLFDKYDVDLTFEGHIHYYMRSKPMAQGQPVEEGHGTTHVITIAIPNSERDLPDEPYVAVQKSGVALYTAVRIDGDTLEYKAIDKDGVVHDAFTLTK